MTLNPLPATARLGNFAVGVALKKGLDYAFDYGAYPLALVMLGYVWGSIVMITLSVIANLLLIQAYDWAKRDLLLIETLKDLRESESGPIWKRRISAALRRGNIAAFVILSWLEDPLVVTLYFRRGSHLYNGFASRDWYVFAASTITANLLWIVSLISAIELAVAFLDVGL